MTNYIVPEVKAIKIIIACILCIGYSNSRTELYGFQRDANFVKAAGEGVNIVSFVLYIISPGR